MRVAVLGLGLIGGSLAQALQPSYDVVGLDPSPDVRDQARAWGLQVIDEVTDAVREAELVVLAAPVPANDALLAQVPPTALVTDVGGVKAPIVARWSRLPLPPALVPGHPMAGAEHAGWAAARPDLFERSRWVLCPGRWASAGQWLTLAELVLDLGAQVVPADPDRHDEAVAAISHAPHVLAAALAGAGAAAPLSRSLGARSFRDLTRVTASPPERTAEFCFANRAATVRALREVLDRVESAMHVLEQDDADGFTRSLRQGHDARRAYDRAHAELRPDVLPLDLDDPDWAAPLLALADEGGAVVGVERSGGSVRLDVRRPA